ncbi:hypothetical protein Barb6XT_02059 [Bacteroidales bacterium Barb6XT]|nr:hypothetical protein Barb6XT_02059 [Bacteroidales bacterium Barb6XT]
MRFSFFLNLLFFILQYYRFFTQGKSKVTGFETLLGVEAGVYYAEGIVHLVNLEGYFISVSTMKGERVLQFTADSDNAEYAAVLPAGVYVLNAAKGKERSVVKKFVVK